MNHDLNYFKMDAEGNRWIAPVGESMTSDNQSFLSEQARLATQGSGRLTKKSNTGAYNLGIYETPLLEDETGLKSKKIVKLFSPELSDPYDRVYLSLENLKKSYRQELDSSDEESEEQLIKRKLEEIDKKQMALPSDPEMTEEDLVSFVTESNDSHHDGFLNSLAGIRKVESELSDREIAVLKHLSDRGITVKLHAHGVRNQGSTKEYRWLVMDKGIPLDEYLHSLRLAPSISPTIKIGIAGDCFSKLWKMSSRLAMALYDIDTYCFDVKTANLVIEVSSEQDKKGGIPRPLAIMPIDFGSNGCYQLSKITSGYTSDKIEAAVQVYQMLAYYINIRAWLAPLFLKTFDSTFMSALLSLGNEYPLLNSKSIEDIVLKMAQHKGDDLLIGAMAHHANYNPDWEETGVHTNLTRLVKSKIEWFKNGQRLSSSN